MSGELRRSPFADTRERHCAVIPYGGVASPQRSRSPRERRGGSDGGRVVDIDGDRRHPMSVCDRVIERFHAAARDNHGVSEYMEAPRQLPPSAGDEA